MFIGQALEAQETLNSTICCQFVIFVTVDGPVSLVMNSNKIDIKLANRKQSHNT